MRLPKNPADTVYTLHYLAQRHIVEVSVPAAFITLRTEDSTVFLGNHLTPSHLVVGQIYHPQLVEPANEHYVLPEGLSFREDGTPYLGAPYRILPRQPNDDVAVTAHQLKATLRARMLQHLQQVDVETLTVEDWTKLSLHFSETFAGLKAELTGSSS